MVRQLRAGGKRAVARYQCNAQFLTRGAETKIDITEIAAVIALVVRSDAQLKNFLFEILRDLIDGARMNRTGSNIDHAMALRHVQPQGNLVAISSDHEFDPRTICETLPRRCYPRHLDSSQRGVTNERFADGRTLARQLLGIRHINQRTADTMWIMRTRRPIRRTILNQSGSLSIFTNAVLVESRQNLPHSPIIFTSTRLRLRP